MKLSSLVIALAFAGAAQAQEVVKIGMAGPITGPSAHLGKDNENGARMALEELNLKGTTIGGKKVRFELLSEDDAADPKQGLAAAQKLIDAKVAGVIGHQSSGTSIPASKLYSDAGIPQITQSATSPVLTHQGFKTTFRVVANDNMLGATLGKYAVEKLKAARIAIIDDRSAYGQGVADEFRKGVAKSKGAQIVDKQYTNPNATDFTAILTAVKAKKPDLIFFGGMDSVAGPMLKQMKALGLQTKFMGGDGVCTLNMEKLGGEALGDNMVTCAEAGGVSGAQEKAMEDFRARYRAKYKQEVQIYAPYVYDAIMAMVDAMKAAKSANPAVYLPELKKVKHQGVTGMIAFDDKGDIKDGALTLYTFKGGKMSKLEVIR